MPAAERKTTLLEASDAYEAWRWGDPSYSKDEVVEIYIQAEKNARAMDQRRHTHFGRLPIVMERLTALGIDPETLEPIQQEKT